MKCLCSLALVDSILDFTTVFREDLSFISCINTYYFKRFWLYYILTNKNIISSSLISIHNIPSYFSAPKKFSLDL